MATEHHIGGAAMPPSSPVVHDGIGLLSPQACAPIVAVLRRIVTETMDHPPVRPHSTSSYLPPELVADAQKALAIHDASAVRAADGAANGPDAALCASVLDEIATMAVRADELCTHLRDACSDAPDLLLSVLRDMFAQVGWMADLGRFGPGYTELHGRAEEWLLSPTCASALNGAWPLSVPTSEGRA